MDLWGWVENLEKDLVEAGQAHNARIIADLSNFCADQEVEKFDSLLPEAKALSKTLNNPWLSIFVGHWEMRHRLGNKSEGEKALADAVALFELAHREETQDCPQSVCVTQDLAACYSLMDGIGWAEERIAVSEETIAKIDPSWACYKCLSCEKALAMLDQNKPKQAMQYLDDVTKTLIKEGEDKGPGLIETQIDILLALGEYDEALLRIKEQEIAAEQSKYGEWRNVSQPRAFQKVNALSRLGRDEEAFEVLPPLRDVNLGDMYRWLEAIYPTLMRQTQDNVWQLGRALQHAVRFLSDNGAHRRVIKMANMTVRLAVARGARWSAIQQLQLARTHLPKLRIDAGASVILDELAQLIDEMPVTTLPVPAEELLAWLNKGSVDGDVNGDAEASKDNENSEKSANTDDQLSTEHNETQTTDTLNNTDTNDGTSTISEADAIAVPIERNPEQEVEWLLNALKVRPDDADICIQATNALRACGAPEEGIDLMWSFLNRQVENNDKYNQVKYNQNDDDNGTNTELTDDDPLYALKLEFLDLLLESGDTEGVERLSEIIKNLGDTVSAYWCLAKLAWHNLDWEGVERHAQDLLSIKPDSIGTRILLARSYMQRQCFQDAAQEYKYIIDAQPEENNFKWDYLTAVTAAEDWAAVRQTANDLGMEMAQNDEPPNENWGWIILRFFEQGDIKEYYGRRISPVSAIIVENALPNCTQHVGDHVVFDGAVLTTPPDDPDERENYIPTFAVVHILEQGGYNNSIFIDGVHPGEEALEQFEAACKQNDYKLWIYSNSGYEVTDTNSQSESQNQLQDPEEPLNTDSITEQDNQGSSDGKGVVLPGIMMFLAAPLSVSNKQIDTFLTEQTSTWTHKLAWLNLAKSAKVNTKPHEEVIERYGL